MDEDNDAALEAALGIAPTKQVITASITATSPSTITVSTNPQQIQGDGMRDMIDQIRFQKFPPNGIYAGNIGDMIKMGMHPGKWYQAKSKSSGANRHYGEWMEYDETPRKQALRGLPYGMLGYLQRMAELDSPANQARKSLVTREIAIAEGIREEFVPREIIPFLTSHPDSFSRTAFVTVAFKEAHGDFGVNQRFYFVDKSVVKGKSKHIFEHASEAYNRTGIDMKLIVPQLHIESPELSQIPKKLHIALPANLVRRPLRETDFQTDSQNALWRDIVTLREEFVKLEQEHNKFREKLSSDSYSYRFHYVEDLYRENSVLVKYLPKEFQ